MWCNLNLCFLLTYVLFEDIFMNFRKQSFKPQRKGTLYYLTCIWQIWGANLIPWFTVMVSTRHSLILEGLTHDYILIAQCF